MWPLLSPWRRYSSFLASFDSLTSSLLNISHTSTYYSFLPCILSLATHHALTSHGNLHIETQPLAFCIYITGRLIQFYLSPLSFHLIVWESICQTIAVWTTVLNNVTIDRFIQPLGMASLSGSPNTLVFIFLHCQSDCSFTWTINFPNNLSFKIATIVPSSPLRTGR